MTGYGRGAVRACLACLVLLAAGCTVMDVEQVPLAAAPIPPADAHPAPIGLNRIRYAIPTGTPTVGVSTRSLRCPLVMRKIAHGMTGRSLPSDQYKNIFRDALGAQGYDVTGDPGRLFDETEDEQRTIYALGARVVGLKMDVCQEESFLFGYGLGYVGEAMMEVEWSVYDMLRRRNVYKVKTSGYAELTAANDEGVALLMENAFAASVHNLGADGTFYDLVFRGMEPERLPGTVLDPEDDAPGLFDPREEVQLPQQARSAAAVDGRLEALEKAVVMIQTAGGHGSGFFITPQGHIVTNAHVVGHARRVRVTLSGKKKAIAAEVLRVDTRRDVALLRLEVIPEGLKIVTLPVRADKPKIGEDVYVIGAPAARKLQDTVTKGIVSAHRYDRREKQWYIQSDAYTYGGNSGGPMIDAQGNLVGITVAAYRPEDAGGSLNLFIPIHDALAKLDIEGGAGKPVSLKPRADDAKADDDDVTADEGDQPPP